MCCLLFVAAVEYWLLCLVAWSLMFDVFVGVCRLLCVDVVCRSLCWFAVCSLCCCALLPDVKCSWWLRVVC